VRFICRCTPRAYGGVASKARVESHAVAAG
jgi:hypothetical protein